MASGGPMQCYQCQFLWPVVGPSNILWPAVGPSKAIGTIFYGQWWAHSRPSGPYFMASGGPIQGHRHRILWPVVGPFEAIGAIFYGQWWAHPRWDQFLWPVVGPFEAISTRFYGQKWAHPWPSGPYFMSSVGPI